MKQFFSFLLVVFTFCLCADDIQDSNISGLTRSDTIPKESIAQAPDPYFEGYLQALVDMHFYEHKVVVLVKDHTVWLANLPKNELIEKSIISFIKDVPGVAEVKKIDGLPPKEMEKREKYVNRPRMTGIWFPQMTELFLPLIANPRQVIYSIGYRGGDVVCGKNAVQISLGDDFPIFRWISVLPWKGDCQVGIEAGIWSVFNIDPPPPNYCKGTELINTDFYVGIPVTYAVNQWSFRLRPYHISSHLGDEFMVDHPHFKRLNPSFEALDFFFSYQASDIFRVYGGAGWIMHSDGSFPMKHYYLEYGSEARFCGHKMYYHKLYGTFFAAVHFRTWEVLKDDFDVTAVAGYEWSKLQGVGRKIRLMGEFHHGFSLEGQFFKRRTTYGSFLLAYGF